MLQEGNSMLLGRCLHQRTARRADLSLSPRRHKAQAAPRGSRGRAGGPGS